MLPENTSVKVYESSQWILCRIIHMKQQIKNYDTLIKNALNSKAAQNGALLRTYTLRL